MTDIERKNFEDTHKVGFCEVPIGLMGMTPLSMPSLGGVKFRAPDRIDERPRFGKAEDQGNKPWCAAYSASQWAENILWRTQDKFPLQNEIDPAPIYKFAKTIDGDPYGSGTSLTAVLEALRNPESDAQKFDPSVCKIRVIRKGDPELIKYAIHKFGTILMGVNVTTEWTLINPKNTCITGGTKYTSRGGHAVVAAGYNEHGVYICNSWGREWGSWGFALVSWEAFADQFLYGAVLNNCLNGVQL